MSHRARLKDIAAKTGFSINTVSVVLRGSSPKIPEATRRIIEAAARELDYLPNALARSLVSQRTRTIGIVLSNLLNPILTLSAQLIEQQLAEHGYDTVIAASGNDFGRERTALDTLRARQVEAILIYPTSHTRLEHLVALRRSGYPVVLLTGAPAGEIDLVSIDNRSGSCKLVSHLLRLGHRRIAFLDAGQAYGNLEKFDGYRAAHEAFGIAMDPSLLLIPEAGSSAQSGYRSMARIMAAGRKPTAIVASADSLAVGILRWCREQKLDVPGDLSVAGFDDIEISAFLDVPLTTVSYPSRPISEQAVARLMTLIASAGNLPPPEAVTIDPDLVIRSSCRPPVSER